MGKVALRSIRLAKRRWKQERMKVMEQRRRQRSTHKELAKSCALGFFWDVFVAVKHLLEILCLNCTLMIH